MNTSQTDPVVTRRTALTGLGAGGLGLALASAMRPATTQGASTDMARHPIVGVWMVTTPAGPALAVFLPDGTNIQGLPATLKGPNGTLYGSTQVGTWEPVSERGVHFTGVQFLTDAGGTLVNTITIDAYPVVSKDGQTLRDADPRSGPIIRDATGAIVTDARGSGPPATGVRMKPGFPGLPQASPEAVPPVS